MVISIVGIFFGLKVVFLFGERWGKERVKMREMMTRCV